MCVYFKSHVAAVGGFCELPGECECRNGFSGNNCEIGILVRRSISIDVKKYYYDINFSVYLFMHTAPTATISSTQPPLNSLGSTQLSLPIQGTTQLPLVTPSSTFNPSTQGLRDTGVNVNAAVGATVGVIVLLILIIIVIIGAMIAIKKHRDKKSGMKMVKLFALHTYILLIIIIMSMKYVSMQATGYIYVYCKQMYSKATYSLAAIVVTFEQLVTRRTVFNYSIQCFISCCTTVKCDSRLHIAPRYHITVVMFKRPLLICCFACLTHSSIH